MKNKLVAISVLLMLLISIFPITLPIMLASGSPSASTLNVVQYGFRTRSTGIIQWTSEDAHSDGFSIKLSTGSASDGAAIIALKCNLVSSSFPFVETLSDLYYDVLTYWAKNVTWTTENFYPWIQIYLDMDKDGVFDWDSSESDWILQGEPYYWLQYNTAPEENGWKQFNASTLYFYDGNYTYSYVESAHEKRTLEWYLTNTPLGDETILRLYIMVGYGGSWVNTIGLVDDIALGGITYYGKIQDAINAANPGDIIIVHEGTYYENLVVPKSLTIQGVNNEFTIIQAQPVSSYGGDKAIEIQASGVTISGFTISGYAATETKPGSTYWGVYAYGSSSSHYSNINITGNIFTFLSQNGIQLGYVDGSLIKDNVFRRETRLVWYKPPGTTPGSYINVTRGGAGPALWYCTNVTVDPNVIQTDGVGIFLYSSSGILIEANVISAPNTANPSDVGIHVQNCTMISIVGNNVFNFTAGPKSGYNWGTNGAGVNILGSQNINVRDNFLHDNTVGVLVQRLDLAPAPRKVDIHYNNFEHNTKFGVLNCYTWIGKNQTYTPASYVTDARFNWWGDSTGPTHLSNSGGTGDAIGDNVDYSPWLGATFETTPRTYHVNPTGAPGAIQEAIDEAASGDTIIVHEGTYLEALIINKTLTVKGASTPIIKGGQMRSTNYGNRQATIFVENACNVVLQDLDVEGQGLGVPAGTKSYAILYENSSGTVQDCTVSPNTIGDMYSVAIAAWDNSDLAVKECLIQNFGRIGVYSNNATISIEWNTIIGQVYSQDNLVNYGIEIEDYSGPSVADIAHNIIYNCNNTSPSPRWSSAAIIVDTWREWADYYQLSLLPSKVTITYNEIYDNFESIEIVANEFSYAYYNNFHDNVWGVWSAPENWTTNPTYYVFDARYNWWGDPTGPYHPTSWEYMGEPYGPHYGLGDYVSDYVLYHLWLPVVHNVAVTDVAVSPTVVVAGETVTIDVTVKNQGTDFESFTVTVYYDDTSISSQDVTNLFPGNETTLTFYWDTTGMPRGNYTIMANATVVPDETDIEDNTLIDGVVEVLWHDVAIIDVVPARNWVYQGHSLNINVTILNEGDFAETVTVTLYYNITANKIIGTQIINLLPGECQTIVFTWDTKGVEYCHNYTLTAVASIAFPDNDPADNTFTDGKVKVRILGDVNGDGIVDIADIYAVALGFGETPDRPRWDPELDINNDGIIDIEDIYIVAINFGKICSP